MRLAQIASRSSGRHVLDPSRGALLAAAARSRSLDRALVDGADPASSRLLAARAAMLGSRCTREALADGLERLERGARGPRRRWWAVGSRRGVLANATRLRELASVLRSGEPVYARGTAMLNLVLTDGTGPAYQGREADLARQLEAARRAIRGEDPAGGALATRSFSKGF